MTQNEVNEIIKEHKHWLNEDCDNWKSMKADLSGADLYGANLSCANLRCANLRDANLIGANLRDANLYGADLRCADLRCADLRGVNLIGADLRCADLRCADLRGVNLSDADLYGADLRGVNLSDADLYGADLSGAKNVPYISMVCPEEGEFIGWKKCDNDIIVELLIPADAKRSSATTRKCRCSKAKVLAFYDVAGNKLSDDTIAYSKHDKTFAYNVGEEIIPDSFDENRWDECSNGIHFFINRQEAINYGF